MSFKKSLAAVAVLGAVAGSAMAANVTLYGVVDEGLYYTYKDVKGLDGKKTADGVSTLKLSSGVDSGTRWGIKGTEELNADWKVGFKLESSFTADDGMAQESRLFRREASLSLISKTWGRVSAGRMGGISSSAGTYDLVMAAADPFDGGDNDVWGLVHSSRYDNMLTYQSPKFAGLQATAQYSFKEANADKTGTAVKGGEGTSHADRYASFALTGDYGSLGLIAAYEFQDWARPAEDNGLTSQTDDGHAFFLGGNYDFGVAKAFLLAQYFQGQHSAGGLGISDAMFKESTGMKGWGMAIGAQVPAAAGKFTFGAYYLDAKAEDVALRNVSFDRDFDYIGAAVRYEYPLSKRTQIYTGAGCYQATADAEKAIGETSDYKEKEAQVYLGVTHRF